MYVQALRHAAREERSASVIAESLLAGPLRGLELRGRLALESAMATVSSASSVRSTL